MIKLFTGNYEFFVHLDIIIINFKDLSQIGFFVQFILNLLLWDKMVLDGSAHEAAAILHKVKDVIGDTEHFEQLHLQHEDELAILWFVFIPIGVCFLANWNETIASLSEANFFRSGLDFEVAHLFLDVLRV